MKKGINSFFVSFIALILATPIAGVTSTFTFSESLLSSNEIEDYSRSSYAVDIDFAGENTGYESITRNEIVTFAFLVSNLGTMDDTYDLEISWEEDGAGWSGESEYETVSVVSQGQENVNFSFQAPVQNVYDNSQMQYTLEVTSQNDSASDSLNQVIDIDMIYAIDVELKQGDFKQAKRGESASYVVTLTNRGDNADTFGVEVGDLPKDWSASASVSEIYLEPNDYQDLTMEVIVPDTAAVDEYAIIQIIARVQEEDYDYIYGYGNTNTTAEDGRTYGVDIVSDAEAKQIIPGGMIIYDISVTNDGDESDSFKLHFEDVSEEGWVSNLSQYEIDNLGPGESFSLVLAIFSPEDAKEDDWSLTKIHIYSTNREQFGDDLVVNTSVRLPVRDVSLSTSEDSMSGNPGSILTYIVSVTNTGSDPDDIYLGFEICESCNAWVVSLSKYIIEDLNDGDSEDVQFIVEIPSSARDTDEAIFSVTAESHDDSSASAELAVTSTVNTVFDQYVMASVVPIMYPGDSNQFNISITNQGNSYESYKFSKGSGVPENWKFEDTLIYETESLEPYGGNEMFVLPFEIPDDENPGYYNFTIYVKLSSSGIKVETIDLSVKVEYYADFTIVIDSTQLVGDPGVTHQLPVTIINSANADEEIDFIVEGLPSTWTYCVSFSGNCLNSLNVAKGATSDFILEITTAENEPANANGVYLSLVGTSSLNNKFEVRQSFKILTNPTYLLSVTTPSDTKTGSSGDTIPFQLVIENLGNDVDHVNLPFPQLPSGWIATYTESSFSLQPMESKTVYLNVDVPTNVFGGNNTITSKVSSDQSGETSTLVFTVFVEEKADIDVELKTTAGDVTAGTQGNFKILITNNGNTVETLTLVMEGKRSSWFTLPKETIYLEPGSYEEIMVEVRPPVTQAASDTSATLNVTLSSDSSKSVKLSLPFSVLKSDLITEEVVEEEEESLLPSLSLVSTILILSLISFIRKKKL
ncbi:MAG: hypothetical protein CMB62_02300 [Euryarchaeota archaeon]|nr:hypothetical protein [Euryarchaeota archaeon]